MEIGHTIKKFRKEKKLSQDVFSLKCGIAQTALSQIERNVARPHKSTLAKICKELDIPEITLYILSVKEEDIPEHKREEFRKYFLVVKDIMYKLIN